MKGCQVCLDTLWLNGKPCPNRAHYYRPKGKTVFTNGEYREREHMGNRKSRPGAPDLRKNKDKGSWSKLALIMALFLVGCTIGRLDSGNLRVIPLSEVHRMDNKGFPAGLFP